MHLGFTILASTHRSHAPRLPDRDSEQPSRLPIPPSSRHATHPPTLSPPATSHH
ncbi:hypothetical protein DENSPDRAFT_834559 [Dentipellis sp. KUC8613]|nr:hypothetical protein DENSPDRAFT_834559 [Dentipellis sp. KUC8613]